MRDPKLAILATLLSVGFATAQDMPKIVATPTPTLPTPPPGTPALLDVGKFLFLDVPAVTTPISWDFSAPGIVSLLPDPPAGAIVADYFPGIKQGSTFPDWHKSPSKTAVPCLGVSEGSVNVSAWGVVGGKAKRLAQLTIQVGPRPPPVDPIDPDVKPKPDPKPVTSFRVIFGYEATKTYPQSVLNILYGNVVEEYLTASCTGGKAGWRRRDKDAIGDNDPTMAALWKAVQAAVTTVPFVAVEVNGKVEIIPFESTPAAMVAKLKTYNGGK